MTELRAWREALSTTTLPDAGTQLQAAEPKKTRILTRASILLMILAGFEGMFVLIEEEEDQSATMVGGEAEEEEEDQSATMVGGEAEEEEEESTIGERAQGSEDVVGEGAEGSEGAVGEGEEGSEGVVEEGEEAGAGAVREGEKDQTAKYKTMKEFYKTPQAFNSFWAKVGEMLNSPPGDQTLQFFDKTGNAVGKDIMATNNWSNTVATITCASGTMKIRKLGNT